MTSPPGYVTHPFGMTHRHCPACGRPQFWCGAPDCAGALNGPGHWSHTSDEDSAACRNWCEKPS